MNHLKKLGLLAVAAAAVMAFAGVASASASEFTASEAGIAIGGGQTTTHKFTVGGSTVTCTTANFSGETEGTATPTQSAHPEYSGCTAFGFAGATVNTAGCDYVFDANTTENGTGHVALENCTNGYITINVETIFNTRCHVTVGDYDTETEEGVNNTIDGITYTDNGDGTVTVAAAATNIHAVVDVSTGLCPISTGTYANAQYSGSTLVSSPEGTIGYDS